MAICAFTITSACWVAISSCARCCSASFCAAYASSRAFAACTASAAVASFRASASFSRLCASDCAIAIFAEFSPSTAFAFAAATSTRCSRRAFACPISPSRPVCAIAILASFAAFASASASRNLLDASDCAISTLAAFSPSIALAFAAATWIRWSRFAFASPIAPSRFFSATDFFASLIAFAAASLPSASIYPDSSRISVTFTLMRRRPILRSSISTFFDTAIRNLSRSVLISSISIVAITRRS